MIHNFSLIHDDLPAMDDDDYRRVKPIIRFMCILQFYRRPLNKAMNS